MDAVKEIVEHKYAVAPTRVRRAYGGSINECFRVDLPDGRALFVKVSDELEVFESEAEGLRSLAATHTIRVPHVECVGSLGNAAYLIMEFIPMTNESDYTALGAALAGLHAHKGETQFGFHIDNYLGITPQKNTARTESWIEFFREHRLKAQMNLLTERDICSDKSYLDKLQTVIDHVGDFFDQDESDALKPSLLHGDLWSGNWGFTAGSEQRQPVIFDPACYWGHNEAELAMMTLFGKLPAEFYAAYFSVMPKATRFEDRVPLYQLYHALNHYNLFGSGYRSLCDDLLDQLNKKLPLA